VNAPRRPRDLLRARAAEEIEGVDAMDGTAVQEAVCSETDARADFAGAALCGDGKSAGISAG
jgi:hypothetical protein